jgi:hypothetical protein
VIKQWLAGDTRDKIAAYNGIGEGSVTNIVADLRKALTTTTMSRSENLP